MLDEPWDVIIAARLGVNDLAPEASHLGSAAPLLQPATGRRWRSGSEAPWKAFR